MFNNFTEEARKILVKAKEEMSLLRHPYVGSEHLLLSILKNENNVSKRLKQYDITYEIFKEKIIEIIGIGSKQSEWFLYTPLLKRIMENAILDSKEINSDVTVEILFSNLLEEGDGVAIRILLNLGIDLDKLYSEFNYKILKKKTKKKLLLEELGVDLTKKAKENALDPVIGREEEIKRVLEILSRRCKNNPILIGEAGVGKTAIVEELSRRIASGDVPISLKNKRIISLDMATTVAGTKYRGEFEDRIRKILKEIEENDDIILFIDEIHTLVGAGGAEGAIDASNIFKPALSRNKLRCIGATTIDEYKKYIENDKALERRFQKVNIEKPNNETVKEILLNIKPIYEKFHNVIINDKIIEKIVELSNKYIYDRNEPDRSIDVLDEVCARVNLKETKELKEYNDLTKKLNNTIKLKNDSVSNNDFKKASLYKIDEFELIDKINNLELILTKNKKKQVTLNDIAEVINLKTKIPVYEILNEKRNVIDKIKNELENDIKGQDNAIKEVINIAKKIKLGFKDDDKCYSILFAGPSGVGKTKLAKLFGKCLVDKNIIKLDMSEYGEAHSVSKIIGSPPGYVGYSDNKNILENIRNNPFSVLILDEIEKAHPSIISLFFQILDDGVIKDSKGNIVSFKNVVIIMTSNIGYNDINVGFNKNIDNTSKLKEEFSIPFINRIDNIINFNYLNEDIIKEIIEEKIKIIKTKYKNINIKINSTIIDEIIKLSNYREFGARKIDKIISDKIENIIIDEIINNKKRITINNLINA
ncbi:MAG: ATP-dependent Clp protease ATP-binding subunit [Firmicutes bacterium]|nr:ATP-dependent Clp protease ATP-binding subunit [Bacillota bacterium]